MPRTAPAPAPATVGSLAGNSTGTRQDSRQLSVVRDDDSESTELEDNLMDAAPPAALDGDSKQSRHDQRYDKRPEDRQQQKGHGGTLTDASDVTRPLVTHGERSPIDRPVPDTGVLRHGAGETPAAGVGRVDTLGLGNDGANVPTAANADGPTVSASAATAAPTSTPTGCGACGTCSRAQAPEKPSTESPPAQEKVPPAQQRDKTRRVKKRFVMTDSAYLADLKEWVSYMEGKAVIAFAGIDILSNYLWHTKKGEFYNKQVENLPYYRPIFLYIAKKCVPKEIVVMDGLIQKKTSFMETFKRLTPNIQLVCFIVVCVGVSLAQMAMGTYLGTPEYFMEGMLYTYIGNKVMNYAKSEDEAESTPVPKNLDKLQIEEHVCTQFTNYIMKRLNTRETGKKRTKVSKADREESSDDDPEYEYPAKRKKGDYYHQRMRGEEDHPAPGVPSGHGTGMSGIPPQRPWYVYGSEVRGGIIRPVDQLDPGVERFMQSSDGIIGMSDPSLSYDSIMRSNLNRVNAAVNGLHRQPQSPNVPVPSNPAAATISSGASWSRNGRNVHATRSYEEVYRGNTGTAVNRLYEVQTDMHVPREGSVHQAHMMGAAERSPVPTSATVSAAEEYARHLQQQSQVASLGAGMSHPGSVSMGMDEGYVDGAVDFSTSMNGYYGSNVPYAQSQPMYSAPLYQGGSDRYDLPGDPDDPELYEMACDNFSADSGYIRGVSARASRVSIVKGDRSQRSRRTSDPDGDVGSLQSPVKEGIEERVGRWVDSVVPDGNMISNKLNTMRPGISKRLN